MQICAQRERLLGFISLPGYSLELRPFDRSTFSTRVSSRTSLDPRCAAWLGIPVADAVPDGLFGNRVSLFLGSC